MLVIRCVGTWPTFLLNLTVSMRFNKSSHTVKSYNLFSWSMAFIGLFRELKIRELTLLVFYSPISVPCDANIEQGMLNERMTRKQRFLFTTHNSPTNPGTMFYQC